MNVKRQARSHQIAIRFTPQEIKIIKRGAKEQGLSISEYLRLMTLLYYDFQGRNDDLEVLTQELPKRLIDMFQLMKMEGRVERDEREIERYKEEGYGGIIK